MPRVRNQGKTQASIKLI